jgi:cholesterol oxidase
MKRLSLPADQMLDHYSVVVVGSGYGGAIIAARVARAGRDVCILERGRELHPGQYPDSTLAGLREIQLHTPAARRGPATALFDFHVGKDISVLVGCGLGGTSLINASVALEPGDSIFSDPRWPAELRHPEALRPFMQTAKEMLGCNPYPSSWPDLPKLDALVRTGEYLGREVKRPDLTVSFAAGPNAVGVNQKACILCGDCCTGCNHGAKNTVLMNYIPDAHAHGAHIFTEVAVRSVRRLQDKWQVVLNVLDESRKRRGDLPSRFVTADVVVLAAGTLGSTEILLRSKAMGLPVSDRLGHRFSGNGDVVAFAYDTDQPIHGVGLGRRAPSTGAKVGPTITGMIDLRHSHEDPQRALIIEDGAIPSALAPIAPIVMYAAARRPGGVKAAAAWGLRELVKVPLGPYHGPIDHTLTYLVMSTDDSGGKIVLKEDRIHIEWPEVAEQPVFVRDNEVLAMAAGALRGRAVHDPLWTCTNGQSLITVHPLGGCTMADDAGNGVVDHKGRVFDPASDGVHEGLYVSDGSVIPLALDVNPLLTISAIAERTAELLIADRQWSTVQASASRPAQASASRPAQASASSPAEASASRPAEASASRPVPSGHAAAAPKARLAFAEHLAGFASMHVQEDFREGFDQGRDDGAMIEFFLTIVYDDVRAVLGDTRHDAKISGTVLAPELSPHRLIVTSGAFTLLDPDPAQVETWHMRYRMELLAEEGKRFLIDGYKVIRKRGARHAWSDTTTLYVTIKEVNGTASGRGILHLQPTEFARLLRSINVHGVSRRKRIEYHLAFLELFAGKLVNIYGGVLDEPGAFPSVRKKEPLVREPKEPDEIWWCGMPGQWHFGDSPDDAFLRLTRYKAGPNGPVILASGFGMSSHSFLAPTISTNMTEFLAGRGYDIWLFDYRASIDLPSARTQFTIDDIARDDWRLAVRRVLDATGRDDLQAFGHCVGSVSLQMAILDGLEGIRSAVCAQFPLHPVTSVFNRVKSALRVGNLLGDMGVNLVAPDNRPSPPDEILDVLLRSLPVPEQERCGQAVCRWINAIYGCTHRHAQLNDATHRALNEMFGVGNVKALNHLTLMLRRHLAVTRAGKNEYLQHPERLANTKLLQLQGRHNYIFHPAGTLRTLRWLRSHNPHGHYERIVLPDYAHLDAIVGARADVDVYPRIVDFFDRT